MSGFIRTPDMQDIKKLQKQIDDLQTDTQLLAQMVVQLAKRIHELEEEAL